MSQGALRDYIPLRDGEGMYLVNPLLLCIISYNAAYFRHLIRKGPRSSGSDSGAIWERYRIEWDFEGGHKQGAEVRRRTAQRFTGLFAELRTARLRAQSPGNLIAPLRREFRETERQMRSDRDAQRERIRQNNRHMHRAIHDRIDRRARQADVAVPVLRLVRDVAADGVIVCAGLLSGGAALAGLGAGSVARGAFRYQDERNLGAAVMTASTSFSVGIIPVGSVERLGRAQHYAAVAMRGNVEAVGKTATGVISGKSLERAVLDTTVSMAGSWLGGLAVRRLGLKSLGPVTDLLGDTSVPVRIRAQRKVSIGAAARMLSGLTMESTTESVMARLASAILSPRGDSGSDPPDAPPPIADPFLADLAILGPDECSPAALPTLDR